MHRLHAERAQFGCARLGYPEVRAAIARAARAGRIRSLEVTRADTERIWGSVLQVELSPHMIWRAGDLAETWALRGYDAVHLAALEVYTRPNERVLASWDGDLRTAAAGLGYSLFPGHLGG